MKRKHEETTEDEPSRLDRTEVPAEARVTATDLGSFSDLGLDSRLLSAVADLGYHEPTTVQSKAIPAILDGRDVVARAKTGSGKTAAYILPVLHRVLQSRQVNVLRCAIVSCMTQTLTRPAPESQRNDSSDTGPYTRTRRADCQRDRAILGVLY
jgi:superfamily II DNA/RNA helicase